MTSKSIQNLHKWGPESVSEGHPQKKQKISNPCIICYVLSTSSPSQNHAFWSLFAPQNGLRASPEGVAKRSCQMMSLLHPKIAKKGPRRSLDGLQDGPKIHPKFDFLVVQSLRAPTSDLRGACKGVPDPISPQKRPQNDATIYDKLMGF